MPAIRRGHPFLLAVCVAVFIPAAASSVSAQNTAPSHPSTATTPTPVYDVMSIKPNNSTVGYSDMNADDSGLFSAHNVSLKQLLQTAFDIKANLISGIPGPIDSARFDIQAKVVDPNLEILKKMTRGQGRQMLLPLLIDRFQLKTHIDVKNLPVYELVVARGGAKLKLSADQTPSGGDINTNGYRTLVKMTARKAPIDSLAKALSSSVDRTVINKTGLSGNFDIDLQWSRDDNPDSGTDAPPTIFTAIEEQLGLKLQPGKGPVDTLVVDHAEMPSSN